ncbi:ATP-dependent nuclease [Salinibacter ruber]|jgi:putative ATP-dependent endonuclease of OLD family|uniref:ATP-dependent nuclease n=1 Tax=Salinibacter ruber TaxID=146919 RepID=UPI000E57671B|nr:AAA family ATPase [Salinibacter ruber]
MYISRLHLQNYRCFENTVVEFDPGVTVIIGENNSGKSSLLSALQLIFEGGGAQSLGRYDFYQGIQPSTEPPDISITATLSSEEGEEEPAELGAVATWLSSVEDGGWEAKLTYHFYLPENQKDAFTELIDGEPNQTSFWRAVEQVLPRYTARIDAGVAGEEGPGSQRVSPRDLNGFGVDFLGPIRDVEREMFSGRKPKLRTMLETVLEDDPDAKKELEEDAEALVGRLKDRINLGTLFELAGETGAEDGGTPSIGSRIREADLIKALRLVIDADVGGTLPVTYNGLGYNNLLYISLVLASLESQTVENVGPENAVVFPTLFLEEPEAHLHPALQFKLLEFIQDRIRKEKGSKQVFATTHSTHITSATGLDAVVSLSEDQNGQIAASYPGRVFSAMTEGDGQESKDYVERFLDATKSTMLFARGVILVEGLSEQILLPTFAQELDYSLPDEHVAVVGVGGRTFKHFLPLFGALLNDDKLGLDRQVACIVDADPKQKHDDNRHRKCYPYQVTGDEDREQSHVVDTLKEYASGAPNIEIFWGEKTLEYDLAKENPQSDFLVTSSCSHESQLRTLASTGSVDDKIQDKIVDEQEDLSAITNEQERTAARFATAYLECINGKGEHTQELNLKLDRTENDFNVPDYIENAIEWVCSQDT